MRPITYGTQGGGVIPRYELVVHLLGLQFLTLQANIPHIMFITSRYVCYFLIFLYAGWIQMIVFNSLNSLKLLYFIILRLFKNVVLNQFVLQGAGGAA